MCNTCGCKKAEDISKDIFGNKSDAKDRAKELGSKHTHSHKINGDVIHMPFKTHKEYQKNMGAESFENETFCADCGSRRRHDAESFDAEVYAIEDGGKTELSFQELFDYLNDAIDNEYFLTKGERDDYYEKYYREYEAESFEAQSSTKEMNEAYKQYKINLEKYVGFGDLWEKIHDESLRLQSQGLIAFDAWNKACKKFKVYDKLTKGVNMEHLREREKRYEPDSYYGGAESFEAPGSVAEDYSEVLHDLDDLEKNVKSIVAPKRRPTKYLRDAKSSVVDSWRQVRKDGFGRELYQPMDKDAESFEAESNFDKLANKIAAQYRAKGKSPAEAMRIGKATAAKIGFRKYGKAGMRRKAMAGRAKSAENYARPKSIRVSKKSSIINYKSVGILSVAGILSYLHFKK